MARVRTGRSAHTATGVPDLANNRLLVYNNSAPGGFDMIQVLQQLIELGGPPQPLVLIDIGKQDSARLRKRDDVGRVETTQPRVLPEQLAPLDRALGDVELGEDLVREIKRRIREQCSPRHVPNEIQL